MTVEQIEGISFCRLFRSEGFHCGSCPAIAPDLCEKLYYPKTEQEYKELMEKINDK